MTTRIRLVCHASTSAVRAADFPGDEPLDSLGRRDASRVTHDLRHADRIRTSPALRTRQTAEALGLDATIEPSLRDWDYGDWTGRSLAEVQQEEPDAVAMWLGDPAYAPGGGETLLDVIHRVEAWLDGQRTTGGQVVAITHAAVIRAAIVSAAKAGARSFWHFDIAPLSMTRLSSGFDRWSVAEIGPMIRTMAPER